jgi:hypothetical protein
MPSNTTFSWRFATLCSLSVFAASTAYASDPNESSELPLLPEKMETYFADSASTLSYGGEAGIAYNDNIYRSPNGEESDLIAFFAPGFRIKTDLQPYEFSLTGNVELGRYFEEEKNNYNDADLRGRAAYNIDPTSQFYLDGRTRYEHVAIGAFADEPTSALLDPTTYRYYEVGTGATKDGQQWLGFIDGRILGFNYDNGTRVDGTRDIQDDRDRYEAIATARVGYKVVPDTAVYLQGSANHREYDKRIDTSVLNARDSDGVEALVGVQYGNRKDKANTFWADAGIGYLGQNYDAGALEDVSTLGFRGTAEWRALDAWRVRADVTRTVEEATQFDTSAYVQSRGAVRVSYDLAEQWEVGGIGRYTHNDFQITPASGRPSRVDNIYDGSVYLDYLLSEQYRAGIEYTRVTRDSDDPAAEFDANVAMLRLGARY